MVQTNLPVDEDKGVSKEIAGKASKFIAFTESFGSVLRWVPADRKQYASLGRAMLRYATAPISWRVAAAVLTVFIPLLLFMRLSDNFSKLLLPAQPLADPMPSGDVTVVSGSEQAVADWAGQINFIGLTIFLAALCFFTAAFCLFVISSTLGTYDRQPSSWLGVIRSALVCLVVVVVAATTGFIFGWNGPAAPIDFNCYNTVARFIDAEKAIKDDPFWSQLDGIGDYIFQKIPFTDNPIDDEKSGSDFIREATVSALFCEIEAAAPSRTTLPRYVSAWNNLNINTIAAYATSILCFITIALLGLYSGRRALLNRGRYLKFLLIALASIMSVGVAQLKSYFYWPIGMLNESSRKIFAGIVEASANYTGLVGSATLFVTFIFPLLLWRYDTKGTGAQDADKTADEFKISDVLTFAAIFAAPAFSGSLLKLLSGGH
jgi:hypothetical protein